MQSETVGDTRRATVTVGDRQRTTCVSLPGISLLLSHGITPSTPHRRKARHQSAGGVRCSGPCARLHVLCRKHLKCLKILGRKSVRQPPHERAAALTTDERFTAQDYSVSLWMWAQTHSHHRGPIRGLCVCHKAKQRNDTGPLHAIFRD